MFFSLKPSFNMPFTNAFYVVYGIFEVFHWFQESNDCFKMLHYVEISNDLWNFINEYCFSVIFLRRNFFRLLFRQHPRASDSSGILFRLWSSASVHNNNNSNNNRRSVGVESCGIWWGERPSHICHSSYNTTHQSETTNNILRMIHKS